ncbi:hypothetical protein [Deinococcus sp.]|uniref:hypothetical protein n=1 Tax=Deinococcus sp. TaxID=47478 RepID=UPI0025C380BB|nr:hypothetical protein [Deinococcus sp.]
MAPVSNGRGGFGQPKPNLWVAPARLTFWRRITKFLVWRLGLATGPGTFVRPGA